MGRVSMRPSGMQKKLPQFKHLGTGEILGVGFAYKMLLPRDLKGEFVIALAIDLANFLDQRNGVAPFEIMRCRMTEYRFEGSTVRTCYDRPIGIWRFVMAIGW